MKCTECGKDLTGDSFWSFTMPVVLPQGSALVLYFCSLKCAAFKGDVTR